MVDISSCWLPNCQGFGYDSTDCAAVRHRVQDEKAQRVIYVIDNGQDGLDLRVWDLGCGCYVALCILCYIMLYSHQMFRPVSYNEG